MNGHRFPFLKQVQAAVFRPGGLTLGSVIREERFSGMRDEAVRRVVAAEYGTEHGSFGSHVVLIGGKPYPRNVLTFVMGTAMCKAKGDRVLNRKFSLAEARAAEKIIMWSSEPERLIDAVSGIRMVRPGGRYMVPVSDYLMESVKISAVEWKLVNQRVERGNVILDRRRAIRLVRHEAAARILRGIEEMPLTDEDAADLEPYVRKVGTSHVWRAARAITRDDYPPCITHAMEQLADGENLPHRARFLLATYLASAGVERDDVAGLFRTAPDYDERITRYQVEQIFSGKYKPPNCSRIESNGDCRRTPACGTVTNPLRFRHGRCPDSTV